MDVEVRQDEAARVLGLGGPHQAPDGGAGQVVGGVGGAGGDGAAGDDDQRNALGGLVGEPALDGGERVVEDGVRDARLGVGRGGRARRGGPGEQQDGVRPVTVGLGVLGQCAGGGEGGQCGSAAVGCGDRVGRGAEDGPAGGGRDGGGRRDRCPVEAEQPVAGGAGGRIEGVRRDLAYGQGVDGGDGGAGRVGELDGDGVLPCRGDADAQRGRSGGVQADPAPGERDDRAPGAAGGEVGGVQGGVEERGVDAEPSGVTADLLGQDDLGVQVLSAAPGGAYALEDGPELVATAGEQLVEALGGDGGGAGGGQEVNSSGRSTAGAPGSVRVPWARSVQRSSVAPSGPVVRVWTVTGRRPEASGSPTPIWTCASPRSWRTTGAWRASSSIRPQPRTSPARITDSTSAVPGTITVPDTAWSASQGWVRSDHRAVATRPSPPASSTEAPSRGWSGESRPAELTSPPSSAKRGQ